MERSEATSLKPYPRGRQVYVRAPIPVHFPSELPWEERVPETRRHMMARTVLFLVLDPALKGDSVGSDQFVYWDAGDPRKCLSPDVFVKLGSRDVSFDSWKIWERGAPELAVEIVSGSDRSGPAWREKLARYQASGIGELVQFDPEDDEQPIRVWDRVEGDLVERYMLSPELLRCNALGLWWVVVPAEPGPQLRLARDREGKELLLLPIEEAQKAAAEAQKATEEAQKAAAEAQKLQAELSEKRAERDAALAEVERLRAEISRLRGG